MLRTLHIQHYALIDQLDIDFQTGFSVVTGETGAGKSIILGAMGLLAGERADTRSIKEGESRCVVEAEFDLSGHNLASFFEENDLEYDEGQCIVRRELTATGKSRAFVNDSPASVAQLKELGERLIDIHSQHQNLLLRREDFQLSVLDTLSANQETLDTYQQLYKDFRTTERELEEARKAMREDQSEQDYLQYQYNQLEEANLRAGEQEELETLRQTLEHAEDIKASLYQTNELLQGDERGIVSLLRETQRQLNSIANVFPQAEELAKRTESCYIELKDIASETEDAAENVDYDPELLARTNERLDLIYELEQKHHTDNVQDLLDILADLEKRLGKMENRDEQIKELEQRLDKQRTELTQLAAQLTALRQEAGKRLKQEMSQRLQLLGMPNGQFEVDITPLAELSQTGKDKVVFLFSANTGGQPQPIAHVASGGEIARVMLALKAILAEATLLPTIVFDEIDTGVSGHIAESMALLMRDMGRKPHRQVISITHLPQIAALGTQHYRVYKKEESGETTTHIAQLSEEERVQEIAHMLSGSTLTEAAIENARALLSQQSQV